MTDKKSLQDGGGKDGTFNTNKIYG